MQIERIKPEFARFIEEQVKAGNYPSPEAVVEAAIADLRDSSATRLDDETVAAIRRAEEQLDRGEGEDFERFAAQLRAEIAAK